MEETITVCICICERCGYKTGDRSNFIKHLNRKKVCQPLLKDVDVRELLEKMRFKEEDPKAIHTCDFCSHSFKTRQGKHKHLKICKGVVDEESLIMKLQAQLQQIQQQLKSTTVVGNQNNGTIINNINNITNIDNTIRSFGHENMDAIPPDFVRSCWMNLEFRPLFENLHYDPNFPENNNIRLKSAKRQQLEIFKDDKWKITPFKTGLNEILLRLHNVFDAYYKKNKNEVLEDVGEEELDILLDQLDEIGKLSKQTEDIKKDIICAIEENKATIAIVK
jgi:hypothetical protein